MRTAQNNPPIIPTRRISRARTKAVKGHELKALDDTPLADRFYSWCGPSGNLYVCTVFGADEDQNIFDMPNAMVIGVAHEVDGRHIICMGRPNELCKRSGCTLRNIASRHHINEWHVHFVQDLERFCEDFSTAVTC